MKLFIVLFVAILPISLYAQETFKSQKYGYSIELPAGYKTKTAIGENTDLDAVNEGKSIIVVVKKLPKGGENITANYFQQISNEQWETSLNEYLPNPHVIKKGKAIVDGKNAFYIHYTTQKSIEPKLYQINYNVIHNGFHYVISFNCLDNSTDTNMPYFMRSLRSFKF